MITKIVYTREFDNNYKKLTHKNKSIEKILDDPEIGVPKSHNLKGVHGVHVNPIVITYTIIEDSVVFITINHHDKAYDETSAIYARLEELYPELWNDRPEDRSEDRSERRRTC